MKSLVLLLTTVFLNASLIAGTANEADERGVEQFKSMKNHTLEPVNSGFVFVNGKYINSPYMIKVEKVLIPEPHNTYLRGGVMYLNNLILSNHLTRKYHEYKGDVDPAIPEGINKNTSIYDIKINDYFRQKIAYVQRRHSREEEAKILANVYKSLPNIKRTRFIDSKTLEIETYNGDIINCSLLSSRRKPLSFPQFYEQTIDLADRYASILKNGGALFFTAKSGQLSVTGSNGALALVSALNSGKTPEERIAYAHKLGFGHFHPDNPAITQYVGSPQLEERLQNLNRIASALNAQDSRYELLKRSHEEGLSRAVINIVGKVTDMDDRELNDVNLSITFTRPKNIWTTESESLNESTIVNGKFSIQKAYYTTVRISFSKQGYHTSDNIFYTGKKADEEGSSIQTALQIKLREMHDKIINNSKSGSFSISGKIVNEDGEPVEGVKVSITKSISRGFMESIDSSHYQTVDGEFSLNEQGCNRIYLDFYKKGYFVTHKYYGTDMKPLKDILINGSLVTAKNQTIVLQEIGKLAKLKSKDSAFYLNPVSTEQDIMDLISFKKEHVKNQKEIKTQKYFYLSVNTDSSGKPIMILDKRTQNMVPEKIFLNYASNNKNDGLIIVDEARDMRDLPTAPEKGYTKRQVPLVLNIYYNPYAFFYYKNGDTYGKVWVQHTSYPESRIKRTF